MIVMDPVTNYMRGDKPIRAAHLLCTDIGADGRAELLAFGKSIGLSPSWLQKRGTPHEHFDLLGGRIQKAIDAGAVRIDRKRLVAIIRRKRELLGLQRVPRATLRARSIAREVLA